MGAFARFLAADGLADGLGASSRGLALAAVARLDGSDLTGLDMGVLHMVCAASVRES